MRNYVLYAPTGKYRVFDAADRTVPTVDVDTEDDAKALCAAAPDPDALPTHPAHKRRGK
jgi:hypothetical protein